MNNAELIRKLQFESENALRQKLSIGMANLCAEAAAEIDALNIKLTDALANNEALRERNAELEEAVEAMQRGMKLIFNHPRKR